MQIFVSYATDNATFARRLIDLLRQHNYDPVTWNGYLGADVWQQDILNSATLVLVYSHSLAAQSAATQQWQFAMDNDQHIIILKLDDAPLPEGLNASNRIDYLDFIEIARQISEGKPGLRYAQYAADVSLRMLLAELGALRRDYDTEASSITQVIDRESEVDSNIRSRLRQFANRVRRLSGSEDDTPG